jgi:hypothetical protein
MAKRHGGDKRGNAASRRARKNWMLSEVAGFGGNGETVACALQCGTVLDFTTVEADRIIPGGSYRRDNVQPACRPCNVARSDDAELTTYEIQQRVASIVSRTGRLTPALAV